MPAQFTTYSHSTSPASVRTPTTSSTRPRGRVSTCSTDTPSTTRTPRLLGAAGQAHREVDRVDPAVAGHVEAGEQVVGPRPGEQVGHLARADLLDLEAEVPLEGRDPAVLVQPVGVGRRLDQPDPLEPGGDPGLRLEPGVEVAGVEPQRGARLARGAEAGHQARRRARWCREVSRSRSSTSTSVDPEVGQVVGDRGADHAAPDDHHPRPLREGLPGGRGRRGRVDRGSSAHQPNLSTVERRERAAWVRAGAACSLLSSSPGCRVRRRCGTRARSCGPGSRR